MKIDTQDKTISSYIPNNDVNACLVGCVAHLHIEVTVLSSGITNSHPSHHNGSIIASPITDIGTELGR